nr:UDP-galactopyranose mutase [Companilactobacillus mishanensis]
MNYLVVGSGLFGATFAYEAALRGHTVNVIEKRDHIAGNVYTEDVDGIQVHKYGAHIFHTSKDDVWDYVNKFADFNSFINSPVARYKGEVYNLPFNMNTFVRMFDVSSINEVKQILEMQRQPYENMTPHNLEEQALKLVGPTIYKKLIKGYTEKQWGKSCVDLPAFIIRRIPIRFTFDNNYFNDKYQGIPIGGYTQIVEKMLSSENIAVEKNTDFMRHKQSWLDQFDKVIYTGAIDEFFNYQLGELEYRSLRLETDRLDLGNYQGNAVTNFTDKEVPFTRVIEHKFFDVENSPADKTVITREYPDKWEVGKERYYPVNDSKNNKLYRNYRELAKKLPNVIFGGRLGMYRYMNMDEVISSALQLVNKEFGK